MRHSLVERAGRWAGPTIALGLALATVAGCAVRPTNDTFDLTARTPVEADISGARLQRVQVLVPTPVALQVLNSKNIVVRLSGSEIRFLADSQWGDDLPLLIQSHLVAGLENTGVFGGVGIPGQGMAINYRIVVEVRDFTIDAAGPGAANVSLSVKILNDQTGVVKSQKLFTASVGVNPDSSNGVIVAALDQAFANVQAEIVSWIVNTI